MSAMTVHTRGGRRISFPERVGGRMILLKVNTACNLRCDYCWYVINPSLRVPAGEEMTSAKVSDLLRNLALRPGDTVYLSGGEAILRRDIAQICMSVRGAGAKAYLTTNGVLRERLVALAPHIDGYVVSLDSCDAAFHDEHRGDHEATVAAIPHLVALRPVCVTVSLSRENLGELGGIADACIEWGVHSLFYQLLWFPYGSAEREMRCVRPAELEILVESLDRLERRRGRLQIPPFAYRTLVEATVSEGSASGWVEECFAIDNYFTNDPRGGVVRCQPHDYVESGGDPRVPPWRGKICRYFSEECTCLMGHFHANVFYDD